jgi:chromosomal replication initiation ATPase DnaA
MTEVPRQLPLGLERAPSWAAEDFIVSGANAAAVEALAGWADWPGGRLALIGPAGSGKTHLARAWAADTGARAILIEDADRKADEEALFHLINQADAGKSVLITGRREPAAWPARLPDLRSRLNALTVAHIAAPDDAILIGLMRRFFSERNIKASEDLLEYMIRRIERSASAARKVVRRLDELAMAEKREVTRTLAKRILEGGE